MPWRSISPDALEVNTGPACVSLMPRAVIRCAECNCYPAICLAAETARECRGCSQVAGPSAECCCWQAANGLA